MKYLSPEMEIVEFDEDILTTAELPVSDKTDTGEVDGGVDIPGL